MKQTLYMILTILILGLTKVNSVFATDGVNKPITINGGIMQTCVKGSGDKTIVMLSGFGTDNPIEDFSELADKLSDEYRVVILEYFGYGSSDITQEERSNEIIVNEIRMALAKLDLKPPYILMPHSMSGLYSIYYANKYTSEIEAIIGIDMSLPQKQLERWSYKSFKKCQYALCGNVSILNEWNKFYDNSKELESLKYPENVPVLAFLATEQIEFVDDMRKIGNMQTSWVDINNNMITNADIQTIEILEGTHYLHHQQANRIAEISKNFIQNKVCYK